MTRRLLIFISILLIISGQLSSTRLTTEDVYSLIKRTGLRATKSVVYDYHFNYPPSPKEVSNQVLVLARIINAEAEGETDEGQLAVGTVVMNRVKSNLYPNSIYGVISQKGQFCGFRNRYKLKPSKRSISNAMKIIYGYRSFDEDILFFKTLDSKVEWKFKYRLTIEFHNFYSI